MRMRTKAGVYLQDDKCADSLPERVILIQRIRLDTIHQSRSFSIYYAGLALGAF